MKRRREHCILRFYEDEYLMGCYFTGRYIKNNTINQKNILTKAKKSPGYFLPL